MSSDASPMDHCAFGLLKWAFFKHYPMTLDALWKNFEEEVEQNESWRLKEFYFILKIWTQYDSSVKELSDWTYIKINVFYLLMYLPLLNHYENIWSLSVM